MTATIGILRLRFFLSRFLSFFFLSASIRILLDKVVPMTRKLCEYEYSVRTSTKLQTIYTICTQIRWLEREKSFPFDQKLCQAHGQFCT